MEKSPNFPKFGCVSARRVAPTFTLVVLTKKPIPSQNIPDICQPLLRVRWLMSLDRPFIASHCLVHRLFISSTVFFVVIIVIAH
jgi:hypothetical protein